MLSPDSLGLPEDATLRPPRPAPGAAAPLFGLRGHEAAVNAAAFAPGAKLLASGDAAGVVHIWELRSRRRLATLPDAHAGEAVLALGWLGGGGVGGGLRLATQGRDGYVRVWDAEASLGDAAAQPLLALETGAQHFCRMLLSGAAAAGAEQGGDAGVGVRPA
mmetsp:Transcript_43856/g.137802  ORF Transcript_43856/g.137802 Transcript_43856/m.137802 type:complete len:162 (-) Transcript_43856:533-1018(-)